MTSAESSVSEPPNLNNFWGRIPQAPLTRLVPSALATVPPFTKNLATALARSISDPPQRANNPLRARLSYSSLYPMVTIVTSGEWGRI